MADIGAEAAIGAGDGRGGLLLVQAEADLAQAVASEGPRGEGETVLLDGAAGIEGDGSQGAVAEAALHRAERALERTVQDDAEGALRGVVSVQQDGGPAEVRILERGMREQHLAGEAGGHGQASWTTLMPDCARSSPTIGSLR